jgi:predicted ester cyclase
VPHPKDVVLQHITAFNARDNAAEPWAPDAHMVAPGADVTGRDAVIGVLNTFLAAFSDGRLEIVTMLAEGSRVAAEGVFRGTHDGPLATPGEPIPPTGNRIAFPWASIYTVNGGELASEHYFYDQLAFLTALGIFPG